MLLVQREREKESERRERKKRERETVCEGFFIEEDQVIGRKVLVVNSY